MRLRALLGVVVLVGIATTGCSDDEPKANGGDATTTTEFEGTLVAPQDTETTDAPAVTTPEFPAEVAEGCTALATSMTSIMTGSGEAPTAEQKAQLEEVRAGLPDAVRADFDALVAAAEKIAGGDPAAAQAAIASGDLMAASQRLSTYFAETCVPGGFPTTTP